MPNTPNTYNRTPPKPSGPKPTAAQLNYLRTLPNQTGTSFAYPATKAAASREIARRKHLQAGGDRRLQRDDLCRERRTISIDLAERAHDATAIRSDEVSGSGSNCRWSHLVQDE